MVRQEAKRADRVHRAATTADCLRRLQLALTLDKALNTQKRRRPDDERQEEHDMQTLKRTLLGCIAAGSLAASGWAQVPPQPAQPAQPALPAVAPPAPPVMVLTDPVK